jgi:genome maintenance exonuclease 1
MVEYKLKKFTYVEGLPELKQLEVDESTGERFYISPNGLKLPSVTTVLGHSKKKSLIEWQNRVGIENAEKIKNRAATRGTKFHNMMESYLRNQDHILDGIMPDMKQSFYDMMETLDLVDNIQYIESPLYSEKLGIAGRTDVIADFGKTLSIIDFKTSTKQKKEEWIENYFLQGTAYALMYEELVGTPINQIVVLISCDDSDLPQVFIRDKNQYVDSLLDKIQLYKQEKL